MRKTLIRIILIFFLLFTALTFVMYLGGANTSDDMITDDVQTGSQQSLTGELQAQTE